MLRLQGKGNNVKYQCCSTHGWKVIRKIQVSDRITEGQMEISDLGGIKTIMIIIGFDHFLLTVSLIQRLKPIESFPNQIKQ